MATDKLIHTPEANLLLRLRVNAKPGCTEEKMIVYKSFYFGHIPIISILHSCADWKHLKWIKQYKKCRFIYRDIIDTWLTSYNCYYILISMTGHCSYVMWRVEGRWWRTELRSNVKVPVDSSDLALASDVSKDHKCAIQTGSDGIHMWRASRRWQNNLQIEIRCSSGGFTPVWSRMTGPGRNVHERK